LTIIRKASQSKVLCLVNVLIYLYKNYYRTIERAEEKKDET